MFSSELNKIIEEFGRKFINYINMDLTTVKDIVIGIAAAVGMLLSIYNFFHSRKREKVRLTIIPKAVAGESRNRDSGEVSLILSERTFEDTHNLFAFEIINNSEFAIVIDEIGLLLSNKKSRLIIPYPIQDKKEWPKEIQARRSTTLYVKLESMLKYIKQNKVSHAYVKTTDNIICHGKSEALKSLINFANSIN